MSYRQTRNDDGSVNVSIIKRLADSAFIPANPENRDYQKYLEWVAEGNTIEDADPLPPPIDLSDSDQLEVALKALLACVAQVGGLTQAQAKAMFKQKYDQISNL